MARQKEDLNAELDQLVLTVLTACWLHMSRLTFGCAPETRSRKSKVDGGREPANESTVAGAAAASVTQLLPV